MQQVRAKKSLGQHFLIDLDVAQRIAATIDDYKQLPVLEVGPGMGVLTQYLLQNGHDLKVVELDGESVDYLKANFPALDGRIIEHDFLKLNLTDACGTGDMVVEMLKRGCNVTGVDLSAEMLAIAQHKILSPGLRHSACSFQQCNAEALPFADESFDAVTCAFGVRNFVHLEQGLEEMLRVLKPGGRMVILELATPDSPLVRPLYNLYARHLIPWLGQHLAGSRDAYTYLPLSIERFPKGDGFRSIILKSQSPVSCCRHRRLTLGVCRLYVAEKQRGR